MTSAIDPTKPTTFVAYTADVRNNFQIAANEITALQSTAAGGGVILQVVTSTSNVLITPLATYVAMRQTMPTVVQITLPPTPPNGRAVRIKDSLGVCGTTPFIVVTSDGTQIDNRTSFTFNASFQAQMFVFDGVEWGVNG